MSMMDAYIEKAKAQIIEWNAEIDKLKAKAMRAHADSKIQYEKTIADLEKKRLELLTYLDDMIKKGEKAFEALKSGVDRAMSDMKSAMDKAISEIK